MQITLLTKNETRRRLDELASLLTDAVRHGASIGYTRPLAAAEVGAYWRGVAGEVAAGRKILLAALDERGRLVGSAQLAIETRSNGRHRAEVQKLMVRHRARGRGIGAALMARLEEAARADGRTLLFLDTSIGAAGRRPSTASSVTSMPAASRNTRRIPMAAAWRTRFSTNYCRRPRTRGEVKSSRPGSAGLS